MAGSLFTDCGVVAIGLSSVRDRRGSEEPDLMPSVMDEALEWFDRAEQAREVAGKLTDPGARRAVLQLADNFDRLGRAAVTPRTKKMVNKGENRNW